MLDFIVYLLVGVAWKGRISHQHFVKDDSDGPPVHSFSIANLPQHLRRNIIWSAYSTVSQLTISLMSSFDFWQIFQIALRFWDKEFWLFLFSVFNASDVCLLAQSKIAKLDMASIVDQDVVRLQVSVDVTHLMNRLDCQDLCWYFLLPFQTRRTWTILLSGYSSWSGGSLDPLPARITWPGKDIGRLGTSIWDWRSRDCHGPRHFFRLVCVQPDFSWAFLSS